MDKKNKHHVLKCIVMGEVIALLFLINGFLVIGLDRMLDFNLSEVTTVTNKAVKDTNVQKSVEEGSAEEVAVEVVLNKEELKAAAKQAVASLDEKMLILVNQEHKVPDDYKVSLVTYKDTDKKVAKAILDPLTEMLSDGEKEGLSFQFCSAYRSNKYQEKLFEKDKDKYRKQGMSEEEAIAETKKSVQPSGYSEHATGLAVDIISKSNAKLDRSQEKTGEFQWLKKNCSEYGFILRYPDGKTDLTGIIYEPWHFRYVGKEAAKFITENEITYEEFYDMVTSE